MWIDKFIEFVPGRRARAVKNVSAAEDYLHDHFPGYPVMPASLILEGMAQTAGILVGQARQFRENVILAKVQQASFEGLARPGDQLVFEACLERIDQHGAATRGLVSCNGRELARIDLIFSHLSGQQAGVELPPGNFVFDQQFRSLMQSLQIESLASQPGHEPS